jgi:peptide/nickel transport system substrate-binding protein
MFETLVSLKPGTTEVVPGLAERWEASNGGKTWAFTLRDGVTFHDGTALDAEAVCFNFDRWYGFTGSFQNPSASYYWQTVFGGFRKTEPDSGAPTTSLYAGCTARDAVTPVIERSRSTAPTEARSTRTASSIRPGRMRPSIPSGRARSASSRGRATTGSCSCGTRTTGRSRRGSIAS